MFNLGPRKVLFSSEVRWPCQGQVPNMMQSQVPTKVYPNPRPKSFDPKSRAEPRRRGVCCVKRMAIPHPSQFTAPTQSPPVTKKRGHKERWLLWVGWLSGQRGLQPDLRAQVGTSWDAHGRKSQLTPVNCPLTSTYASCHTCLCACKLGSAHTP